MGYRLGFWNMKVAIPLAVATVMVALCLTAIGVNHGELETGAWVALGLTGGAGLVIAGMIVYSRLHFVGSVMWYSPEGVGARFNGAAKSFSLTDFNADCKYAYEFWTTVPAYANQASRIADYFRGAVVTYQTGLIEMHTQAYGYLLAAGLTMSKMALVGMDPRVNTNDVTRHELGHIALNSLKLLPEDAGVDQHVLFKKYGYNY